jgi:hypothetical protein
MQAMMRHLAAHAQAGHAMPHRLRSQKTMTPPLAAYSGLP